MIPAQLETKEEAEQVKVSDVLNFQFSGWLALVTITSETEAERPGV